MRAAIVIAGKDLRQKIRDRSALLLSIVAPLGLAFLFSTMIPSTEGFHTTYVVVDLDGGPIATGAARRARSRASPMPRWRRSPPPSPRRRREPRWTPARSTRRSSSRPASRPRSRPGQPAALLVIGGGSTLPAEIARSVLAGFGSEVTAVQVGVQAALAATGAAPEPSLVARLAAGRDRHPGTDRGDGRTRRPIASPPRRRTTAPRWPSCSSSSPRSSASSGLLAERRTGTLARMLASPVGPSDDPARQGARQPRPGRRLDDRHRRGDDPAPRGQLGRPAGRRGARAGDGDRGHGHRDPRRGVREDRGAGRRCHRHRGDDAGGAGRLVLPASPRRPEGLASLSVITPHAWFIRGINDLAAGGGILTVAGSILVLLAVGLVTGGVGLARARRVVVP